MDTARPHDELGYGDVGARPDVDGIGKGPGGGESGGGARKAPDSDRDGGVEGGQSEPGYSGPANPNAPRKSDA